MPKRSRAYHEFLLEQLAHPIFAAEYLNEARQDSQKMFLKALRNVAESRRMAVLAAQTGLNRESLYKSLSEDGNPRLDTYDSVLSALGLEYKFKPKRDVESPVRIPVPEESQLLATGSTAISPITTSMPDEPIGIITRIISRKPTIVGAIGANNNLGLAA